MDYTLGTIRKPSKYKKDLNIFTNYSAISEKEHKLVSELGFNKQKVKNSKKELEILNN